MTMFSQQTPGGYAFGECVSALQKRIRAGDAREAAYWAVEIEACGAKERRYLWNRFRVIVSEDIGPTSEGNALVPLISALAENYHDAWAPAERQLPPVPDARHHSHVSGVQDPDLRRPGRLRLPAIGPVRHTRQRPGQAHRARETDGTRREALAG